MIFRIRQEKEIVANSRTNKPNVPFLQVLPIPHAVIVPGSRDNLCGINTTIDSLQAQRFPPAAGMTEKKFPI